jgi:hypothetical protein
MNKQASCGGVAGAPENSIPLLDAKEYLSTQK